MGSGHQNYVQIPYPSTSQVEVDAAAEFICEVIGEPTPELTWTFSGQTLQDEGRYMVFEEDGQHHLQVYDVVPEDTGTYTVTATNTVGEVTCSAELTVEGRWLFPVLWRQPVDMDNISSIARGRAV